FQAEDGIRDKLVTGVQTCALPIYPESPAFARDLAPKKILDVLAGKNGVQILLNIRYRVGLAPPAGFMAAHDSFLEIAQGPHLFEIGRASCRERVWMSGLEERLRKE